MHRRHGPHRVQATAAAVWLIVTLLIVVGAFAPFDFDPSVEHAASKAARVRLNPLISPETGRPISPADTAQNLVLFAPFGAAAAVALGRRRRSRDVIARIAASAAITSAAIEAGQLFIRSRTTSLTDVIVNTTGAVLAGVVCRAAFDWLEQHRRSEATLRAWISEPRFIHVVAAFLLACAAAWQPFDATLDPHVVRAHLRVQFASRAPVLRDAAGDVVRGALFGLLVAEWLMARRVRNARRLAALACALTLASLEASQVVIESRTPHIAAAALLALAAAAGAGTASCGANRTRRRVIAGAMMAATIAVLALTVRAAEPHGTMASLTRVFELAILVAQAVVCVTVLRSPTTVDQGPRPTSGGVRVND